VDRLMRARVLLAEASALGVTIEDLVAEASSTKTIPSSGPTWAEYVDSYPELLGGNAGHLQDVLASGHRSAG
jgi:hypothetical protein